MASLPRVRLKTPRTPLAFTPVWEGPIEDFATSFARKNEWKVTPLLDQEDLLQHARIIFYNLMDRYWPEVQNPRHFFSLFRRSLINKTANLAKQRTRKRMFVETDPELLSDMVGGTDPSLEDVETRDLLDSASRADGLDLVVRHLVLGELHPRPHRSGARGSKGRIRDATNQFLCRVAHKDPKKVNLVKVVKKWVRTGQLPE